MKKLPIGIQTFEKIVQDNYCYVDKTHFVRQLLNGGTYYFLSRPRRFGKSLFLSTLRAAFEGRRELFQGLFLYDNWDWSQSNPVVHISFGSGVARSVEELQETCDETLYDHSRAFGLEYHKASRKGRFAADQRQSLCRQVPHPGNNNPLDRGGIFHQGMQCGEF